MALGPNQQTNVQVTLTGSNAVLGGTYGVTIEGLSAGAPAPRTATLNLFVADYSLSTNPRTREIYPGQMPPATYAGTISAANGYNFSVALGCAPGTTAPPANCLLDGAASETVSPPANFALTASDPTINDYNFNLQGVGGDPGAATRLLSETLRVVDFSVGPLSANSITMPQSSISQPLTFQLTPLGSFDLPVTLACPSMPAGASCFFNGVAAPAMVTFSGQPLTVAITVQTDGTIAASTYSNIPISIVTNPARPGNLPALTQLAFSLTVTPQTGSTDLSVSDASADAVGHGVGAPLTLTFTLTNSGTAVNQAEASITFPHPVLVQSAGVSGVGSCGGAGLTDTVVCDNGGSGFNMAATDSRTLTVVVVPSFGRTLTGQVVVNSELPDSNVGNNSASFTRQIRPRPFAIRGLPAILP